MTTRSALVLALGLVTAAAILGERGLSLAVAQAVPSPLVDRVPVSGTDVLLTMPLLEGQGWFLHAFGGRVRACTVDGASVVGDRTAPRCSNWTD
jgi:hypothetical protein